MRSADPAGIQRAMNRGAITYRKLRAPTGDGDRFIDPPLQQSRDSLRLNQERWRECADMMIAGVRFSDLQLTARRELIRAALDHTQSYQNIDTGLTDSAAPIVLTGHQPTLFHPGVWFKSFCLATVAQQTNSLGINLLIDQDLVTPSNINVPTRTPAGVSLETIAFDKHTPAIAIEEYRLQDENLFASFPERVKTKLPGLIERSILDPFWSLAQAAKTEFVGLKFAQARHQLECRMGMNNLDVPWSSVCSSSSFARFILHLMQHAGRFCQIYNDTVNEYRQLHGIRSHSHPVPELQVLQDRIELPLWSWSSKNLQRERVFCNVNQRQILISDLHQSYEYVLDLDQGQDACVQQIQSWQQSGLKIRSRALLTTLVSRLILSDLFIHGIGGAKYDQLTDRIIQQFFGIQPPVYSIATTTALLPIPKPDDPSDEIEIVKTDLRNIRFSPEKYIKKLYPSGTKPDTNTSSLLAQKQQLIDNRASSADKRDWHNKIQTVNHQIQQTRPAAVQQLSESLEQLSRAKTNLLLLQSREFPFILFPQETFTRLLESTLKTP